MPRTPPSHKRDAAKPLDPDNSITRAVNLMGLKDGAKVLDLPVGTGRHAHWLAKLGHAVTVADIDPSLVQSAVELLGNESSRCDGVVLDATDALPFPDDSFDAVLIVDFVHEALLRRIGRIIRPGGWLAYKSYQARGENWRQLLPPGVTMAALTSQFDIVEAVLRPAGPTKSEAETVRLLAQRRSNHR